MKYRDITIISKCMQRSMKTYNVMQGRRFIAQEQHCPVKIMINEIVD